MTILQVQNLVKRFGGLAAVDDVSFELAAGRILALIGPNGAGKTTCFNMIAGAFAPSGGRIMFDGQDVTGLPAWRLNRRGMARTFQIVKPLATLSVFDNLMVAGLSRSRNLRDARENAERVLERVGMTPLRDAAAGALSIGNLKRLEVARALATGPRLLLMDEPMGGLTPTEVERAISLIRDVNAQGVSVVLIEHIMQAVMAVADAIAVLHNGELIAQGAPQDVVRDERVVKAYLGEGYAAG